MLLVQLFMMSMTAVSAFLIDSSRFSMVSRSTTSTSRSMLSSPEQLEGLLSTLYASNLQPAHGHSQPLWGPPDPYLTAGKSIPPSMAANLPAPTELPESAQALVNKGYHVVNGADWHALNVLPGFAPTRGFLPGHQAIPETPESFAAQVEWAAGFLNVIDALPYVAFGYALIEFFLLRPNLDVYAEEVAESGGPAREALVTTAVRVGALCVVAIVTTGIMG